MTWKEEGYVEENAREPKRSDGVGGHTTGK